MKHIINLPQLEKFDGSPYLVNTGKHRIEKDGCGCDCHQASMEEPYSLAQWLQLILSGIPMHRITMTDANKAMEILRACHQKGNPQGPDVIDLEDDHYTWLNTILFDDAKGKALSDNKFEGAYALSMYGYVALAVKRGLEQFQPPVQLVKAAE